MSATRQTRVFLRPDIEVADRDPVSRGPSTIDEPEITAIGWVALRTVALVAIAVLLVQVVFPALLGAAGPPLAAIP